MGQDQIETQRTIGTENKLNNPTSVVLDQSSTEFPICDHDHSVYKLINVIQSFITYPNQSNIIIFPPITEIQYEKPRLLLPAILDIQFFISCSIRKVAEVLAEVDDILLIDSCIHYINKRVNTAFFLLLVINTLATINTYSMKQPDLYYFETIKMTSQA